MALAVVGGALLSAFVDVLFEKLASPEVVNLIRGKKPDKLLQKVKNQLIVVRVVLADAEKRQITDSTVKEWLDLLKDVIYEVDDLLDEVSTKAATQKELSNSFSRIFNRKKIVSISKLEEMVERLDDILKPKESLDLKDITVESYQQSKAQPTSLEDGYGMYGRAKDKEAIMQLVLEDRTDGEQAVSYTRLDVYKGQADKLGERVRDRLIGVRVVVADAEKRQITDSTVKEWLDLLKDVIYEVLELWLLMLRRDKSLTPLSKSGSIFSKMLSMRLMTDLMKFLLKLLPKRSVRVVVADAEKRQITDSTVKEWLDLLKDVIYEVLELWLLMLRRDKSLTPLSKSGSIFSKMLSMRKKIVSISKLEEMVERLDDILKQKESLDLKDIPVESYQQWKAQPTSLEDGTDEFGKETKISKKTRHLSFTRFSDPVSDIEVFDTVKSPRTFLLTNYVFSPFNNEMAPHIIVSMLKYLRVLSFCHFQSPFALPDSIGELIHLRYVNLTGTSIKSLPESVCNLYNLQTLKLSFCYKLTKLPSAMQNLVNLRYLEILDIPIKEMPKRMGKLNQLQKLDFYIAGKRAENSIKELGGLPNLRGAFSIKGLENVTKGEEALEARIRDKKHITHLSLEWSIVNDNIIDFQIELDVLSKLQPHQDLKSLSIDGYKGTRFPKWMGNFCYCHMTRLSLYNCNNCCMLPSMGQLPSLKFLNISDMNSVKTIDAEFFKMENCSSVIPFPSLERLEISDMPCWEVWNSFDSKAFPVLKSFYITDCPKLKGALPNHLPALQYLSIVNCELLVSSVPRAPTLRSLEIRKSDKVVFHEFPLLVESIDVEGGTMVESMMEAITNIQPTSLKSLTLQNYSSVLLFPGDRLPASLKTLRISGLTKMKFPMQHKHELLESLSINNSCESLTSLQLAIFPNLTSLRITNCENMESLLVSGSDSLKSLNCVEIGHCPNFVSFLGEGLSAPNLTCFSFYDCDKLKSLPDQMGTLFPKTEYLIISNCQQIESFPVGGMPPNLIKVSISNCEKLLSGKAWVCMDMVTSLDVWGPCDGINSFPEEGLLPPSLKSLRLCNLSSLETLDCMGFLHLTSLRELYIENCKTLENVAGERLPVSLTKLIIMGCPLLQKRCHKKDRHIWPKICHVRGIKIDGRWI
ncbi:adenylate cyclase [Vigna unguiculata]|uniref:Adenylate cyclase n=1 Tax=Vigna unguiculata TaxID=3917 RepID=A0A4D6MPN0_VIGUN|nr:adenylate cyclase [Vigna unguiculata]